METRTQVLELLEAGRSQAEIARLLGVSKSTVADHARRVREPDACFRRRYDWRAVQVLSAGLLPDHCQTCGISEWNGRPISLELHHVNGDGTDNRLANLEVLCPNCHSQTDTWGGARNAARAGLRLIRGGRDAAPSRDDAA